MRWTENSVELRLPREGKTDAATLFTFLESTLRIDLDRDVYAVQPEYRRKVVTIVFKNKDRCQEVAELDNGDLLLGGKKVSLKCSDNIKKVRILDLPWHTPHSAVVKVLSQYGSVEGDMGFEFWTRDGKRMGVSNGTRHVRMTITRPIPSYVRVGDFTALSPPVRPATDPTW